MPPGQASECKEHCRQAATARGASEKARERFGFGSVAKHVLSVAEGPLLPKHTSPLPETDALRLDSFQHLRKTAGHDKDRERYQ